MLIRPTDKKSNPWHSRQVRPVPVADDCGSVAGRVAEAPSPAGAARSNVKPLAVDLDGTLLQSDVLLETAFAYLKREPHHCYRSFLWLLKGGKPHLKGRLASETDVDVCVLPYDRQIVDWLRAEKDSGRPLVLATATDERYASRIAAHLGLFDKTLATTDRVNLSSRNKRDALVREFGEKGFDYVGNSHDDLPIWKAADRAYVVNPAPGVEKRAKALGNVQKIFRTRPNAINAWRKALRLHQWLKNLLVFVPLAAAHSLTSVPLLTNGALAFVFFGLCASSVYLLNDLLDLEDDRHHPSKRRRPFAAGHLSIKAGLLVAPLLLLTAFVGALSLLPIEFAGVMAMYYFFTLSYSLGLKRIMIVDVVILAMLYTIRIVAGTAALQMQLTFWLLAFSMFIFLSLALVKRYAELREARSRGDTQEIRGRGYYPEDLQMISSLGAASGYLAVLVLALYIQDAATLHLYRRPELIWLACPLLLFWVSRTWLLTHRGKMHDDPVVFAVKDRVSLLVGAAFVSVFWLAA